MRLLIALALVCCVCYGEYDPDASGKAVNGLRLCSNALGDCSALAKDQDASIALLKAQVASLQDEVVDEGHAPLIPIWAYVLLGVVVGGVGTKLLLK